MIFSLKIIKDFLIILLFPPPPHQMCKSNLSLVGSLWAYRPAQILFPSADPKSGCTLVVLFLNFCQLFNDIMCINIP